MSKKDFATPEHNAQVGFKIAENKAKDVEEAHEKILRAET